jgi:hypothetical protein
MPPISAAVSTRPHSATLLLLRLSTFRCDALVNDRQTAASMVDDETELTTLTGENGKYRRLVEGLVQTECGSDVRQVQIPDFLSRRLGHSTTDRSADGGLTGM